MRENGKFTGRGLGELLERARRHDDATREDRDNGARFSYDEFAVLNWDFRSHQEIDEPEHAKLDLAMLEMLEAV